MLSHFLTKGLESPDPATRLAAIRTAVESASREEEQLCALRQRLEQELLDAQARLEETRRDSHVERERRGELERAIRLVDRGIPAQGGVIPELQPFAGSPGLAATREALLDLREAQDEWAERLAGWEEVRSYRLLPGVGKHYEHGRLVLPGEVVQLTGRAYHAWRDKFEPVAAV